MLGVEFEIPPLEVFSTVLFFSTSKQPIPVIPNHACLRISQELPFPEDSRTDGWASKTLQLKHCPLLFVQEDLIS